MPTLDWIGKKAVVNHHRDVPYRLIHCDKNKSYGDPDAGNLLVQGDNLEALKALLPYYAGKVKCIYIDPPYNTGNESWVYNDNVNSPEIRAWLGSVVGKEAEDLSRHDKWLCMMYPRLRLLKEFLTDDGIILASIDDNELTHLSFLMDELFGRNNFIAKLIWEKGRKNDAKLFSTGHDYILVYARKKAFLGETTWRTTKDGVVEIATEYHRLMGIFGDDWDKISDGLKQFFKALPKDHPSKKYQRAKNADNRGVWRDNNISWHGGGGPKYDLIHPVTKKACKVPDDGWRFVEDSMLQKIEDGYVIFRDDHTKPPIYKSYVYVRDSVSVDPEEIDLEGQKEVLSSVFYRHSQPSNDLQKSMFGAKAFPNPKDHEILARLIRYVTSDDKYCTVLDSFGGSGSTAHAILELNASDNGERRFVTVEMDKDIAETITCKRLELAQRGYLFKAKDGKEQAVVGLGGGFRFCTLGEPLFDADGNVSLSVTFPDLAAHVFFCETGSPIPKRADGSSSLIGMFQNRAIYLLHSAESVGVAREQAGNVLTSAILESLPLPTPEFSGARIIYAEGCTVPDDRLSALDVTFKQIPYQIEGI
ncbi:site-specific DNA-methyltransferase [Sinorhizobium meliloti]|nr:site-specific DNA-methyltransferase [Sinorhizobium meliloti]